MRARSAVWLISRLEGLLYPTAYETVVAGAELLYRPQCHSRLYFALYPPK